MEKSLELFKNAYEKASSLGTVQVEVVECNVGFNAEGNPMSFHDAPIQIRFLAYPQHEKNGKADN